MGLFGSGKRQNTQEVEPRFEQAREIYMQGKFKIVTTEHIENRSVKFVFGLVVTRGYNPDNAFFGLISRAIENGADAILGYRESVAIHPDGDKHYSCYGTAVLLDPINKK